MYRHRKPQVGEESIRGASEILCLGTRQTNPVTLGEGVPSSVKGFVPRAGGGCSETVRRLFTKHRALLKLQK